MCVIRYIPIIENPFFGYSMIRSFSVENFRSIRNRQTVSFETTADKVMRELLSVEVKPGCFINKLGVFYGANASGKSNILFALEAVFSLLVSPYSSKELPVMYHQPFKLSEDKPVSFKVDFFVGNIEYTYEISYVDSHIISESLNYYPSGSRVALFYNRKYVGRDMQPEIEFGNTLKLSSKTKQSLIESTFNNHTLLSTIGKLSLKEDARPFTDLFNWIMERVHNVNGDRIFSSLASELNGVCADVSKKEFYKLLLSKADFNIVDFSVEEKKGREEFIRFFLTERGGKSRTETEKSYDVMFTNHSVEGDFEIDKKYQSDGTLRFIELLNTLYDMVTDNHVYFFDELGNRMHYDLLVFYLTIYLYNSEASQLLFSTHSIMLLEEEFMRRDMVYLTEKDRDNASSSFTRISDMGLHKNLSLYNAYRYGKLGAKPEIGSPYLNMKNLKSNG